MHTPLCKHAEGEPEEYPATAERRGLSGIVMTCHNPMPDGYTPSTRMHLGQFEEYERTVGRATEAFRGRIDV